jgi:SAM-dependent methyltransferase
MTTSTRRLDTIDLEARVKSMYEQVATEPHQGFHFETGRGLAERLGYPPADLNRIPAAAIDSFAGVGYFLDLATLAAGETVLDLGSGSGMDSFLAALAVGQAGTVIGVDMTPAQLAKARALAAGWDNVTFREGYIEQPPVQDGTCDCVMMLLGVLSALQVTSAAWPARRGQRRRVAGNGYCLRSLATSVRTSYFATDSPRWFVTSVSQRTSP